MSSTLFVLLVRCLAVLACAGCVSDPPKPFPNAPLTDVALSLDWDQFALGPGDAVLVRVLGHPELSTHSEGEMISSGGTLSLPMVGEVHVTGSTPEELEREVELRLGQYLRTPDATVSVRRYNARKFYIIGEMERPGAYVMDRPLNALQALSESGRFNRGANREEIVLLRGMGPDLTVTYLNAESPDELAFSAIQPDDILVVQRKGSAIFEERIMPIIAGVTTVTNSGSYIGLLLNAWNRDL